jgi:hypothetical protein
MNKTMKMIAVAMAMCMTCAYTAVAAPKQAASKHGGKPPAAMVAPAKATSHAKGNASARTHKVHASKPEKHVMAHKTPEPKPPQNVGHHHKPAHVHAAPTPPPRHETVCVHHTSTTLHADDLCSLGASLIGGLVGGLIGASL